MQMFVIVLGRVVNLQDQLKYCFSPIVENIFSIRFYVQMFLISSRIT